MNDTFTYIGSCDWLDALMVCEHGAEQLKGIDYELVEGYEVLTISDSSQLPGQDFLKKLAKKLAQEVKTCLIAEIESTQPVPQHTEAHSEEELPECPWIQIPEGDLLRDASSILKGVDGQIEGGVFPSPNALAELNAWRKSCLFIHKNRLIQSGMKQLKEGALRKF